MTDVAFLPPPRENPLGMGGVMAKRYGELVHDLWNGSSKSVTPLKFRVRQPVLVFGLGSTLTVSISSVHCGEMCTPVQWLSAAGCPGVAGFCPGWAARGLKQVCSLCMCVHVVCTCGVYMWCACGVHVVCMWCACGVHVLCMLCACVVHVVCMLCACCVHVLCMWCACVCMWCACGVHVCACGVHVVCMCTCVCACGVHAEDADV